MTAPRQAPKGHINVPFSPLNSNAVNKPVSTSPALQPHFRIEQIASLWELSTDTVRKLFVNEPGVLRVRTGLVSRRSTLLIPTEVLERVHTRLSESSYTAPHAHSLPQAQRQMPAPPQGANLAKMPLPNLGGRRSPRPSSPPIAQDARHGESATDRHLVGNGRRG